MAFSPENKRNKENNICLDHDQNKTQQQIDNGKSLQKNQNFSQIQGQNLLKNQKSQLLNNIQKSQNIKNKGGKSYPEKTSIPKNIHQINIKNQDTQQQQQQQQSKSTSKRYSNQQNNVNNYNNINYKTNNNIISLNSSINTSNKNSDEKAKQPQKNYAKNQPDEKLQVSKQEQQQQLLQQKLQINHLSNYEQQQFQQQQQFQTTDSSNQINIFSNENLQEIFTIDAQQTEKLQSIIDKNQQNSQFSQILDTLEVIGKYEVSFQSTIQKLQEILILYDKNQKQISQRYEKEQNMHLKTTQENNKLQEENTKLKQINKENGQKIEQLKKQLLQEEHKKQIKLLKQMHKGIQTNLQHSQTEDNEKISKQQNQQLQNNQENDKNELNQDLSQENQLLKEYILEQQKKMDQNQKKEQKMVKLLLAIKQKGIDIDKIYNIEVLNDETEDDDTVNNNDNDNDNNNGNKNQKKIIKNPIFEKKFGASYRVSSEHEGGQADCSIINDSDESSFNFYGRQSSMEDSIIQVEYLKNHNRKIEGSCNNVTNPMIKNKLQLNLSDIKNREPTETSDDEPNMQNQGQNLNFQDIKTQEQFDALTPEQQQLVIQQQQQFLQEQQQQLYNEQQSKQKQQMEQNQQQGILKDIEPEQIINSNFINEQDQNQNLQEQQQIYSSSNNDFLFSSEQLDLNDLQLQQFLNNENQQLETDKPEEFQNTIQDKQKFSKPNQNVFDENEMRELELQTHKLINQKKNINLNIPDISNIMQKINNNDNNKIIKPTSKQNSK